MSITKSETIAKIAAAMNLAQSQVEGAKKTSANPHLKSKYADLGSVWDACREAVNQNGLAVLQMPGEFRDGTVAMTTLLTHASGEWVQGEGSIPIGAKVDAQTYGSATTYARRYHLAAMLGICPEDDDGHSAAQSRAPARQSEQPKPQAAAQLTARDEAMLDAIDLCETATALDGWTKVNGAAAKESSNAAIIRSAYTARKKAIELVGSHQ